MTLPAYSALTTVFTRLYRYQHLGAFMGWDQAAMMPPGGNEARGAALAELQLLMHQTLTDPALPALMTQATNEALSDEQRASLHEMRRDWEPANLLPARLVEAQSLAGSRCEHAWRTQRKSNDWPGFLDNFREVVTLAREEAHTLSQSQGVSPYDALMGKYEPGTRSADIEEKEKIAIHKALLPFLVPVLATPKATGGEDGGGGVKVVVTQFHFPDRKSSGPLHQEKPVTVATTAEQKT